MYTGRGDGAPEKGHLKEADWGKLGQVERKKEKNPDGKVRSEVQP